MRYDIRRVAPGSDRFEFVHGDEILFTADHLSTYIWAFGYLRSIAEHPPCSPALMRYCGGRIEVRKPAQ